MKHILGFSDSFYVTNTKNDELSVIILLYKQQKEV